MTDDLVRFLLLMPGTLLPLALAVGLLIPSFGKLTTSRSGREMSAAEFQRAVFILLLACGLLLLALVMSSIRNGLH